MRQYSRRQFFPMLVQELIVNVQQVRQGKPAYTLENLGDLPDDKLAVIRPMISPLYRIRVVDGQVCSQFKDDADAPVRPHFPTTPEYLAAFNRFNGRQSLQEIAGAVAAEFVWETDAAFRFTRDLFLALAAQGVVVPQNPLDTDLE